MPSTEARRFVASGRRSSTRGPSKVRGGKRRSRPYKFQKTIKEREGEERKVVELVHLENKNRYQVIINLKQVIK